MHPPTRVKKQEIICLKFLGFAILPNKFASGGIGSARASERGGLSSPQITSPGHHKKLHSLEPLEQGIF